MAGVPAKFVKYRFSESLRELLRNTDLSSIFDCFSKEEIPLIYSETEEDIKKLLIMHSKPKAEEK